MVVPEAWLTRDYAAVVQYLLLRWFRIEFIVEDTHAAWFPDAQVKTTLLVARRISRKHSAHDWADEQFRSMGMDPGGARFLVVKNPMNYRVGYAGRFCAAYVLDTPGATPASLRHVKFSRLQRPYFPADEDIPGLEPVILRGR